MTKERTMQVVDQNLMDAATQLKDTANYNPSSDYYGVSKEHGMQFATQEFMDGATEITDIAPAIMEQYIANRITSLLEVYNNTADIRDGALAVLRDLYTRGGIFRYDNCPQVTADANGPTCSVTYWFSTDSEESQTCRLSALWPRTTPSTSGLDYCIGRPLGTSGIAKDIQKNNASYEIAGMVDDQLANNADWLNVAELTAYTNLILQRNSDISTFGDIECSFTPSGVKIVVGCQLACTPGESFCISVTRDRPELEKLHDDVIASAVYDVGKAMDAADAGKAMDDEQWSSQYAELHDEFERQHNQLLESLHRTNEHLSAAFAGLEAAAAYVDASKEPDELDSFDAAMKNV